MKYYIFEIKWSQTETEHVIVYADSLASAKLQLNGYNVYSFEYCGCAEKILGT